MEFITQQTGTYSNLPPSVATIGFFDGVHHGHRYLIGQVCEKAKRAGLASMLITFPVHPRQVMQTDYQPSLLSTFDEKCNLLADTGADYCVALPFDQEMARLSAWDFMKEILHKQLNVRTLVIGYDHRFGHNRSENFEDYVRYGQQLGIEVVSAEAFSMEEINISSSVVRLLLKEGEVKMAARCLGYNYFLNGHVTSGLQIGRTLGYPTANLQVDNAQKLIPANGVYAARIHMGESLYKGVVNIGCRPTIDESGKQTIEAHLLHFDGNLYNQPLCIEFVARIRGEQKFSSRKALAERIEQDARQAEEIPG